MEILTNFKFSNTVIFSVLTPCSIGDFYQSSRGTNVDDVRTLKITT